MKDISFAYLKSTFIYDILACIPALVTGEKYVLYFYFKIFRYLQMPRTFEQIDYLVRKAKAHFVVQAIAITNIFMLFKTFFILLILFHTLASMWIYIGNEPGGWRDTVLFDHQKEKQLDIYMTAFYYITTTATTIGYGDIHAKTESEKLFAIMLEFVGILIFSAITGNIRKVKKEPDLQSVINKRVANVEEFIFLIDRLKPHVALDDDIYVLSTSYIEQSYRFGVAKSFKGNQHYERMSSRLKN